MFSQGFPTGVRHDVDIAIRSDTAAFIHLYSIDIFQIVRQKRPGPNRNNGIVMAFRLGSHQQITAPAGQVDIACAAKGPVHFDFIRPVHIVFHMCIRSPF